MTVQVRNKVYETNSSSSHSVTVVAEEMRDFNLSKDSLRSGVIRAEVYPGGYGWQWIRFYRPENVLAYLLYQAASRTQVLTDVDLADNIRQYPTALHIIDTVEKATGCKVEFVFPSMPGAHFYVDHDSMGNGLEYAVPGREEELLQLIFGQKSYIEMGNDNSQPGEFIESDIGDIPSFADRMVNEPIDGEGSFRLEFSLESEDVGRFIDGDGTVKEGMVSEMWLHSVFTEMRGVTLADVHVDYAPSTDILRRGLDVSVLARNAFFQWINEIHKNVDYADPERRQTDVRILDGFNFSHSEFEATGSRSSYQSEVTISIAGVAARAVIEDMSRGFDSGVEMAGRFMEMRAK